MNISGIKNVVTSKVVRSLLVAQKHSPAVLFGAGVVGVVATAVLTGKATLKLEATLEATKTNLETSKSLYESTDFEYSQTDFYHDRVIIYARGAWSLAKLYSPAITVGVTSIALLAGSHAILSRRNVALTAAYSAVDKAFKEYRDRVRAQIGSDKELEIRHGYEEHEVLEETSRGPKVKVHKRVPSGEPSMYARFFDDRSSSWCKTPEYNVIFLRSQQNYMNDQLQARGHVFLNDVFDALGIERTSAGSIVGWVKNQGDNYVDFGVFDSTRTDRFLDFVAGREGAILLDFNVDGVIWDKI